MSFLYFLILLRLSGVVLAAEKQLGVEFTGIDKHENEEIQRNCGLAYTTSSKQVKKIINGQNVTSDEVLNDAQWMVSIAAGEGSCSGVLISRRHVLTAAHCQGWPEDDSKTVCSSVSGDYRHKQKFTDTDVSKYKVRVYTRFGHEIDSNAGRTYKLKRVIFPASFTVGNNGRHLCKPYNGDTEDIAIYELKEPVAIPSFVCLANVDLPFKTLTNYGYGDTGLNETMDHKEPSILKKHNVKYMKCRKKAEKGTQCVTHAAEEISSTCHGDSGGPIVTKYYNRTFTVGVLTAGTDCAKVVSKSKNGYRGEIRNIITSVPYYKDWICKWTGICVYGADALKDRRPTRVWDYTGEKKLF